MNKVKFVYTSDEINNICNNIIKINEEWLNKMFSIKNLYPSYFLNSYLYKFEEYVNVYDIILFLEYVSNDKDVREASIQFKLKLDNYFTKFFNSKKNYKLFLILKKIKSKDKSLKKLINDIFKEFKNNGVQFEDSKRLEFIKLFKSLIENKDSFSSRIANDNIKIEYSKDELIGVSNEDLKHHIFNSKKYIFNTSYPDENIILKDCQISSSRKKMFETFNNIATKNMDTLKNIVLIRKKISSLFGFKSIVYHYLDDNRIATFPKINILVNKLLPVFKKKAIKEYNDLLIFFNKESLYDYDVSYYSNIYKNKILKIDDNLIKEYFPFDYTINKILEIFSEIFCIKSTKEFTKSSSSIQLWDDAVISYIIYDNDNTILGYLLLDLFPRSGKFTHAATFSLQSSYKNKLNKRVLPISAIVCNFTPPFNNKTSLLTFSEIKTFCHELGHALHNILSKVKYEAFSGTNTEEDFVEMPSQLLENWCYNESFLNKITKHYKDGSKMPIELIQKIKNNKKFHIGIHFLTQILYIKYDLEIHNIDFTKDKLTSKYIYDLWFNICNEINIPYKISKNIHPMCRFDHLMDYTCGYYGYLWSYIYATDVFTMFDNENIFNKDVGMRFRKTILEKGGSQKGLIMLKNFLKRNPNNKAFIKYISV